MDESTKERGVGLAAIAVMGDSNCRAGLMWLHVDVTGWRAGSAAWPVSLVQGVPRRGNSQRSSPYQPATFQARMSRIENRNIGG
ncbi:MAG: hypothetical protein H6647_00340 [Anaerolineales bacterium]|nr:hypothetical protein [Anaerolineales bacterium]MCO5242627.1 hypothetical protein [Anaerolineae bacterium]